MEYDYSIASRETQTGIDMSVESEEQRRLNGDENQKVDEAACVVSICQVKRVDRNRFSLAIAS